MIAVADDREARRVASVVSHLEARDLMKHARAVAGEHGVDVATMLSRARFSAVARARHALCARLYAELGSYSLVGRVLDLDHVTVMNACRQHAKRSEAKR